MPHPDRLAATLTIDPRQPRFPVAPHLYGLFIEEINRAGDGGLLAEQVQNRRFQDSELPPRCTYRDGQLTSPVGWTSPFPAAPGTTPGWTLEGEGSLTPRGGGGARLEAPGPVTLVNHGFWGVSVRPGVACDLRVLADPLPTVVELWSPSGRVLASAPVKAHRPGEGRAILTPSVDEPQARLALRFAGASDLRYVSLVPRNTWKHRPDGLRADLVETLAGLSPRFLRFPGGCFVEGFSLETASRWKETIGPVEDRPGQWTLWHYRTTNGLGYHEYLQLAEDLGMTPLFVVNCGLSCQGRPGELVPLDELQPFVQDMLDAVEYANGPVDSPWGRRRAEAGHPEPFGLRWIEIGNENFGKPYWDRYPVFEKALKARYPDIQTIFNVHWEEGSDTHGLAADLIDEHFYPDGEFFRLYHDLYDSYPRSGPQVYLGEYAQTVDNAEGTLAGALNEAAFLTGVERNQDLVTLTSYAPLLAHTGHTVWRPDLVAFDARTVVPSVSYQVQALFGAHRGQTVVPCSVEAPKLAFDARGGATVEARYVAAFRSLVVDPPGPTDPDPAAPLVGGEWGLVRRGRPDARRATVKAVVTVPEGGLRLRFLDRGTVWERQNYWQWELDGAQSKLVHINGWSRAQPGPTEAVALAPGSTHTLTVEWHDGTIACRLDDRVVHRHTIGGVPQVFACAALDRDGVELVVKLVNTAESPVDVAWNLGAARAAGPATGQQLAAGALPMVPRALGPGDERTLPPLSLTVVRLPIA